MAKKAVAKKKEVSKKYEVKSSEQCFVLIDGSSLKSLWEVEDALEHMSDDVFYYHVNDQRNDFSNWVRGVFEEAGLADEMMNSKSKDRFEICLLKFLLKSKK